MLALIDIVSASEDTQNNVNWYTDYNEALKIAKTENKYILIDFTADWCGACKDMENNVLSKGNVKKALNKYICIKIDIDKNKELSDKFNIRGVPILTILDSNGIEVDRIAGSRSEEDFIKYLEVGLTKTKPRSETLKQYESDWASDLTWANTYEELQERVKKENKFAIVLIYNYTHGGPKENFSFLWNKKLKKIFQEKFILFRIERDKSWKLLHDYTFSKNAKTPNEIFPKWKMVDYRGHNIIVFDSSGYMINSYTYYQIELLMISIDAIINKCNYISKLKDNTYLAMI